MRAHQHLKRTAFSNALEKELIPHIDFIINNNQAFKSLRLYLNGDFDISKKQLFMHQYIFWDDYYHMEIKIILNPSNIAEFQDSSFHISLIEKLKREIKLKVFK